MCSYRIYSLQVASGLKLAGLRQYDTFDFHDVVIELGDVRLPGGLKNGRSAFLHGGESVCFRQDGAGSFLISCDRIVVEPHIHANNGLLSQFILGPCFAVLHHLRQSLVLHASAVLIAGAPVLFLGGPAQGKSTLAARFAQRGYPPISDDIAIVTEKEGDLTLLQSPPVLRLEDEAAAALGIEAAALSMIHPASKKRLYVCHANRPEALHVSPGNIYVIDTEDSLDKAIEPIAPAAALLELVRHSYCASILGGMYLRSHFLICARLVQSARCLRLPRIPAADIRRSIDAMTHMVLNDIRERHAVT